MSANGRIPDSSGEISHYEIFNYWKDKAITESGEVIEIEEFHKDNPRSEKHVTVVTDWGEPCCWACERMLHGVNFFDKYHEENGEDEKYFIKVWDQISVKRQLEKSHIIPRALGGKAYPENMFLLCSKCHRDSPDTIFKNEFLKWVYRRRSEGDFELGTIFADARKELLDLGVPLIPSENWSAMIGFHGVNMSKSSFKAAVVGSSIKNYDEIIGYVAEKFGKKTSECLDSQIKTAIKKHKDDFKDCDWLNYCIYS